MTVFAHSLTPLDLPNDARILQPPRAPLADVTGDSAALLVMTDLASTRLITVAADAAVDTALAVMINAKIRLLLVMGQKGNITGLVSAQDLMGEKPLRVASELRIRREEVNVGQVMTRAPDSRPLRLADVEHALVRDVVAELITRNEQHVLVVEPGDTDARFTLRGIFSLTQIARQLGEQITLGEGRAESFADLERLIA